MRWVVARNLPITEVDNDLTRSMSIWKPISSKTLKKLMEGAAAKIGAALATEMGELFGLIFDGWSHASLHYIGIFAVYEVNGKRYQPLLGVSPLEEGQQDADAHIRLMSSVLAVYNKTIDMARFLVADNCATNKSIATNLGIPLVGCASHRFNLAANKLYADSEDLLEDVNSLMAQLRNLNNFAELAKHTELRPVKRNMTRWSSTFAMVERYIRIRAEIKKVEAVEEMVSTGSRHRKLVALCQDLKKLNSVSKRLQREDIDMAKVQVLFDSVKADFPVMSDYLNTGAKIVHSPAFEAAVVKTIAGQALTTAEKQALKPFQVTETAQPKRKSRENDYAAELLRANPKKPRNGHTPDTYSKLVPLIPPTSNAVERLFSQCQLILTPQRSCMMPANFEMLTFLRVNMDMWNASTMASVEDQVAD
jgi:hypothetical protein